MGGLPADCESIGAGLIEEGDGKEHATPGKIAEAAGAVYNFCNEAETLRSLPNIPVVALTSMREDKDTSQEFIQLYYAAHQRILELVDDGTHMTADAGHYIQKEMPDVLISSIQTLYDKITR